MATILDSVEYITAYARPIGVSKISGADNLIRNYGSLPISIINWSDIDTFISTSEGVAVRVENIDTAAVRITYSAYTSANRPAMELEPGNITYFIILNSSFQDNIYVNLGGPGDADDIRFHGLLRGRRDKVLSLNLGKTSSGASTLKYYLILKVLKVANFIGGGGDGFATGVKIPTT